MIYRIRIMKSVDGKLVFDRYADKTEMQKLRVNADGKVEEYRLAIYKDIPPDGDVKADVFWFDVSDTHFVEWGLPNGIYQFNTYRCIKSVSSYSPIGTVFTAMFDDIIGEFYLISANDSVRLCSVADGFDSYFEYIGNVWESPELVGEA